MLVLRTVLVCLLALPAAAQYTLESAGPCAAETVSAAMKSALEGGGHRVKDPGGEVLAEAWLAKSMPTDNSAEKPRGSDFTSLAVHGFMGVIRFAKSGADFRGQPIAAGVYTMRFGLQPEDGDHAGASPRRDHLLLVPAAADTDPAARPVFDDMVAMSRKASGTAHPQVLFLMAPESGAKFPGLHASHGRQVLTVKAGSVELGITVVGKAEE